MIGLRSKRSGALFESILNRSCEFYLEQGFAQIEKNPEPFHTIKHLDGGKMIGFYEKAAQPDYKGCLCDGTCIVFEAKHTDTDRIRQSAVTEHQQKELEIYSGFGAQCFVMVSFGLESFYRVTWDTWKNMKQMFGHLYMNEQDLKPYMLQTSGAILLILDGIQLRD